MKKWKKMLIVAMSFLAIATVNADQNNCCDPCCQTCEPCAPCTPCCDIPVGPTTSAYNHPANIQVCGCWDAFVTGTFLWVLPSMEQLEFAQTIYPNHDGIGKIHEYNFDWKPAFKAGIGFNFDHDNWLVYLQYLRINSSMNNKHTSSDANTELVNMKLAPADVSTAMTEVKGKWELDFNTFDLEFGRPYYNGKCLQFSAHYGLKGGWIDNTFETEGITTTELKATYHSKSWLVGPRAGIKTKWMFDDGFRFFGDAAASLFYQKFYKIDARQPNGTLWDMGTDFVAKQINAALESILGIGWGTYFDRNKWHFDLAIGYEVQLFLNQNKLNTLHSLLTSYNTKAGNLMFHGLNVTMQFDF